MDRHTFSLDMSNIREIHSQCNGVIETMALLSSMIWWACLGSLGSPKMDTMWHLEGPVNLINLWQQLYLSLWLWKFNQLGCKLIVCRAIDWLLKSMGQGMDSVYPFKGNLYSLFNACKTYLLLAHVVLQYIDLKIFPHTIIMSQAVWFEAESSHSTANPTSPPARQNNTPATYLLGCLLWLLSYKRYDFAQGQSNNCAHLLIEGEVVKASRPGSRLFVCCLAVKAPLLPAWIKPICLALTCSLLPFHFTFS